MTLTTALASATLVAAGVALGLAAAGCSGDAGTSAPTPAGTPSPPAGAGEWTEAVIDNLATGYTGATGVWDGFDPGAHPALAVYRTPDQEFASALAINFPSPGNIGEATPLSVEGTPFTSLHYFTDLNADIKERVATITHFDLYFRLADVDTFVMIAGGGKAFFEPTNPIWTAAFMHELFHRHQILHFEFLATGQDVENYAYTAENIAMAMLEDHALREAVTTDDADTREIAARRFAALRMARLAADSRVVLDNSQERIEGTARYLEHGMAGSDTRFTFHGGNYEWGLFVDPQQVPEIQVSVKEYFGFGRFYATGAAVLRTLDLLGAPGVEAAVQGGKFPAEVLIEHLGITQADVPQLVADARAAYDPDNTVTGAAERAAAAAATEVAVLPGGGGRGGTTVLTAEELQCLDDHGVKGSGVVIPAEVMEECIGSTEGAVLPGGGGRGRTTVLTAEELQCLNEHGVKGSGAVIPAEVMEECIGSTEGAVLPGGGGGAGTTVLTDEELQCLSDHGVEGSGAVIPAEVMEECIGSGE